MTWITENWVWLLVGVAFIAMHLVGHGGHAGHGGHGSKAPDVDQRSPARTSGSSDTALSDTASDSVGISPDPKLRRAPEPRSSHQH